MSIDIITKGEIRLVALVKFEINNIPIIQRIVDEDLQRGSIEWDFVDDLNITKEDSVFEKQSPDAFYQTKLEVILKS